MLCLPCAVRFYEMHNRKRIRGENKGIDSHGISKKANEEWAALDATGRTPFKHMHEDDKKRFEKEMETFHRHNHMDENEGDMIVFLPLPVIGNPNIFSTGNILPLPVHQCR